jgi:hypothetical protein
MKYIFLSIKFWLDNSNFSDAYTNYIHSYSVLKLLIEQIVSCVIYFLELKALSEFIINPGTLFLHSCSSYSPIANQTKNYLNGITDITCLFLLSFSSSIVFCTSFRVKYLFCIMGTHVYRFFDLIMETGTFHVQCDWIYPRKLDLDDASSKQDNTTECCHVTVTDSLEYYTRTSNVHM